MTTAALVVLPGLAVEINNAHAQVEGCLRAAVPHALRAGELLIQAKSALPHGDFGKWLSENCTISERTAQGYMRLSRVLPTLDPLKAQRVAEMPLRVALRELAAPWEAAEPGRVWETAVLDFLAVCRSILDETRPADDPAMMTFLPRMINDLRVLEGDCVERRIRSERELGILIGTERLEKIAAGGAA